MVRNKAISCGAEAWLDALPGIVADLERDWAFTLGRAYEHGTEAFVAEANLEDGTGAVLKLVIPRSGNHATNEATVLRLARGDGCPQLYRSDDAHGALLVERLGPTMFQLGLPIDQRHEHLCAAAQRIWRPAPDCGLPTGAAKAAWLAGFIERKWEQLDRPCTEAAVVYALACADRRIAAHDDELAVLVHGDVHQWNALQSADGFKLVDPDGLLAEAEYDLGILMREDPAELLAGHPRHRSHWLAARTGLNEPAIWEWGVIERVSTGLLGVEIGLEPEASRMLAVADRVALAAED